MTKDSNLRQRWANYPDIDADNVSITDLIRQLHKALELVPEQYRDSAKFTAEGDYDSSSVSWQLTYWSPITQEEIDRDAKMKFYQEQREREQFEALKKKYG